MVSLKTENMMKKQKKMIFCISPETWRGNNCTSPAVGRVGLASSSPVVMNRKDWNAGMVGRAVRTALLKVFLAKDWNNISYRKGKLISKQQQTKQFGKFGQIIISIPGFRIMKITARKTEIGIIRDSFDLVINSLGSRSLRLRCHQKTRNGNTVSEG